MNVLIKRVERMQSFQQKQLSQKTIKETILFIFQSAQNMTTLYFTKKFLSLSKTSNATLKQTLQRRSLIFSYLIKACKTNLIKAISRSMKIYENSLKANYSTLAYPTLPYPMLA